MRALALPICLILIVVVTTGCATITTGTSQAVLVDTEPTGAICRFSRLNKEIGVVNPTPGMLSVDKSIYPLSATCTKDGFYPAGGLLNSNYQPMTMGNILFGGIVGIVIDSASGAQSIYDASIKVTLKKIESINLDAIIDDINRNGTTVR
jgi:hypothetical protein